MDTGADEDAVKFAAQRFLDEFENLDLPTFKTLFTQNPTVFFPSPYQRGRATGRDEVFRQFQQVFKNERASSNRTEPPYFDLPSPADMHVQTFGNSAVATFHLPHNKLFRRRTLVFQLEEGVWRIAHLHATNSKI